MSTAHPLSELRASLGLTQQQLATELETSQSYISQVESGGSRIGRDFALAVKDRWPLEMARLGITVETLLRGSRSRAA